MLKSILNLKSLAGLFVLAVFMTACEVEPIAPADTDLEPSFVELSEAEFAEYNEIFASMNEQTLESRVPTFVEDLDDVRGRWRVVSVQQGGSSTPTNTNSINSDALFFPVVAELPNVRNIRITNNDRIRLLGASGIPAFRLRNTVVGSTIIPGLFDANLRRVATTSDRSSRISLVLAEDGTLLLSQLSGGSANRIQYVLRRR